MQDCKCLFDILDVSWPFHGLYESFCLFLLLLLTVFGMILGPLGHSMVVISSRSGWRRPSLDYRVLSGLEADQGPGTGRGYRGLAAQHWQAPQGVQGDERAATAPAQGFSDQDGACLESHPGEATWKRRGNR